METKWINKNGKWAQKTCRGRDTVEDNGYKLEWIDSTGMRCFDTAQNVSNALRFFRILARRGCHGFYMVKKGGPSFHTTTERDTPNGQRYTHN